MKTLYIYIYHHPLTVCRYLGLLKIFKRIHMRMRDRGREKKKRSIDKFNKAITTRYD